MDTKHLLSYITFAKEGTYAKTARKLHYAESTLIDHISALEKELGAKLVQKTGRTVTLTPQGKQFLAHAEQLLNIYDEACHEARRGNTAQGLRIIASESLGLVAMPPIYSKFFGRHPDTNFFITSGQPATFCDRLLNDEVDIAFGYRWGHFPADRFECTILFQEPAVYFAKPSHPLSRKSGLMPKDFENQTFILTRKDSIYYEVLHSFHKNNNILIKLNLFVDSGSVIKEYVMAGRGISVLPRSIVHKELQNGSLVKLDWQGDPIMIDIVAVTLKRESQNPVLLELINIAKDLMSKLLTSAG